jgi:hypothetical protein
VAHNRGRPGGPLHKRDVLGIRYEVWATIEWVDALPIAKANAAKQFLDAPCLEADLADDGARILGE